MTQEEKQLVLKDLCARLPYNVKVAIDFKTYLEWLPDDVDLEYPYKKNLNTILRCSNKSIDDISQEPHILYSYICSERFSMLRGYENREYGVPVEYIKPYLRPMETMTKEEQKELESYLASETFMSFEGLYSTFRAQRRKLNFLSSKHLDISSLIPMGLALEAPSNIYNIK